MPDAVNARKSTEEEDLRDGEEAVTTQGKRGGPVPTRPRRAEPDAYNA